MFNTFHDEYLLRRIEANDPNIISITIKSDDTVGVSYEQFDRFGRALAKHTNINEIKLKTPVTEDNVDLMGWLRFLGLIGGNRSITEFRYASYSVERSLRVKSATILRDFLERNDALKFVTFDNLDPDEAEEFASALASRQTALESIRIYDAESIEILRFIFEKNPAAIPEHIWTCDLGNEGAEALARFLESAKDVGIRKLMVSDSDFGPRGLQRIARALARRDSPLDSLKISLNSQDQFLEEFATEFWENPDSLPNHVCFTKFYVCEEDGNALGYALSKRGTPLDSLSLGSVGDDHATFVGVTALLHVFNSNPSKSPKHLHIYRFHNDFMEPLEQLLQHQMCSLEVITYCRYEHHHFFRRLTSVCCNETSINTTYDSNHTLEYINDACPQLKHYLAMNRYPDKKKVARIKVYDTHFARDFQPNFFAVMQPSLLSEVLPFVNQAFVDHQVFTSEAAPYGNEAAEQATNNSLNIHFMMLKEHPSLLSNRLVNRH